MLTASALLPACGEKVPEGRMRGVSLEAAQTAKNELAIRIESRAAIDPLPWPFARRCAVRNPLHEIRCQSNHEIEHLTLLEFLSVRIDAQSLVAGRAEVDAHAVRIDARALIARGEAADTAAVRIDGAPMVPHGGMD